MGKRQTEVLVIGGGATGTGVLRDLAMRGFKAILVEKRDFSHGTSGRFHGILHSGGRYAVKDPQAARECSQENRILRRIMPHCIEDTGGFYVLTPWDDADYLPYFLDGCRRTGIPAEEIPVCRMLKEEPYLNPRISHCISLPDAALDSFMAVEANVLSAREHSAQAFTYHLVERLLMDGQRVVGAHCQNMLLDEEVDIYADLVVNASGAWAGQVASSAGITLRILASKGTMIAVNHRIVNTVINRCRMPSDGDILVPAQTVAIIGTTDIKVEDPNNFSIEHSEIHALLEEGEKLIPGFREMRMLRAWAGLRPLYQEDEPPIQSAGGDLRGVSRAFTLLDHAVRDGVEGLITISGGKLTTYRKMAEATADLVCQKLGVHRACRTALEPLPQRDAQGYRHLGARLSQIEEQKAYGNLICECELATYQDVVHSITIGEAKTIDDVRRDVRLGMGPCQGGFCTLRIAGMLHDLQRTQVEAINTSLHDFLQERWKGLLPVLWGQQLRQERLNELIYKSVLNAAQLPGPARSALNPSLFASSKEGQSLSAVSPRASSAAALDTFDHIPANPPARGQIEVLVIGAGLAGLAAAWQASSMDRRVQVIAKGPGTTHWQPGCIDVLGYDETGYPIATPAEAIRSLIRRNPRHPYAVAGLDTIDRALRAFQSLCDAAGYPLQGSVERNWLLPTSLGTLRLTCLAPLTMIAGDVRRSGLMLIVGFQGLLDFYPTLIAENLARQGYPAQGLTLDISAFSARRVLTTRGLAALFEDEAFRTEIVKHLKIKMASGIETGHLRLGFPAVLGIARAAQVHTDLQERLDCEVFEIPTLPPSISGLRFYRILVQEIERQGGEVRLGSQIVGIEAGKDGVRQVWSEAAARRVPHPARHFILATGGVLGGGINMDYNGYAQEIIFDFPVQINTHSKGWFDPDFLSPSGHPIFRAGLEVNDRFQPVISSGQAIFQNVFAVGNTLAHCDAIQERSIEGIALASGFSVANNL